MDIPPQNDSVQSASTISFLVTEEAHGDRLDRFLAVQLPQYSREYLKSLIQSGQVCLDAQPVNKPSSSVQEGQTWSVHIPEPVPLVLAAEAIPLEVVFEDEQILVINKPCGMLTHPTGKEQSGTLVNALLHHCHGQLSGINGVERPGIVHRLDRETSGLLMVAKTDHAHRHLQLQLQARTAKRHYWAIAQGAMPRESGTIDAPIDRHPKQRDKMTVANSGRPAVTHWTVMDRVGNKASLLQLQLETGRTHQIRVHLSYRNHPIFGDPLYGTGWERQLKYAIDGQALQAFQLTLRHPLTEEEMTFTLPMAEKIQAAWAFLQNRLAG